MPAARDVLSRLIDWPGPTGPGYVNAHWWSPHKDHPLPDDPRHKVWWGKPVKTLDEFLSWASWAMRQPNIRDIYYCTSVQSQMDKTKAGKPKALRNRANAVNLKCFFLDVDYGKPDKDGKKVSYATLQEAVSELTAFCLAKSLPGPSALVATGGGIHAYWILDTSITPAVWQPYADGLKNAALEYGLLCDAGVTIDCARILRVPDTTNWKSDPPRPVRVLGLSPTDYTLSQLAQFLTFAPVTATVTQLTWGDGTPMTKRPHLPGEVESLAEGLGYEEKLVDWVPIVRQCRFFGEALSTGGRDYSNPLWNLTTLGATFMENGEVLAHKFADGHAGYNKESTDALWERKLRERADRNLGWPTCATIETNGCRSCATCPLKGTIKSPLALGRAVPSPASVGPTTQHAISVDGYDLTPIDLPANYVFVNGVICRKYKRMDDDGELIDDVQPLFTKYLTGAFCTLNPAVLNFVTTVDKGNYHRASLRREDLGSKDKLVLALLRENVLTDVNGEKFLREFFMSLMSKLENEQQSLVNKPFGWHYEKDGELSGFVFGGTIFKTDKTAITAGYVHTDLKAYYRPTGQIQPWYDAAKFITDQHAPVLECILAVAFSSPLMEFAGEYSTLIWAWGQGGRGKSTALEIGLAAWGHPALAKEPTSSTQNALMEKMGKMQCLPLYWDEIKDDKSMGVAYETFWQGSLGTDKSRMQSGSGGLSLRQKQTWHTQVCSTSNSSLIDFIERTHPTTDASVMRCFEMEVTEPMDDKWHVAAGCPGIVSYHDANDLKAKLAHNFGCMGYKYAEYLGNNAPQVQAEWKAMAIALDTELSARPNANKSPQVERYWRSAISTLLMGATIANRLGCDFHIQEMHEYLIEQYDKNVSRVKTINVNVGTQDNTEQKLTSYLKFQRQNTIWTDKMPAARAGRVAGMSKPKVIRGLPLDRDKGTEVQWFVGDRVLRIGKRAFRRWLTDYEKVSTFPVIRSLIRDFGATEGKQTLGAGTRYAEGQEDIVDIPVPVNSELEEMMLQGELAVAANGNEAA